MSRVCLEDQLAGLADMVPTELDEAWRRLWKTEPPRLPAELLRHGLAYRLQQKASGVRAPRGGAAPRRRPSQPSLSVGTELVRGWNGRTISVRVVEEGFVWEERAYSSLSAIARAVTGTAWSGPRFFGLTGRG